MKKIVLLAISMFLFFTTFTHCVYAASGIETIVIMRHGEKPKIKNGQINCQGFNRALSLTHVLVHKFGRPDFIYAPNPENGEKNHYLRAIATIEPTAISLQLPVDPSYKVDDHHGIVNELLSKSYRGSTIFVTWEHKHAVKIARLLMKELDQDPDLIPKWKKGDFDSLYVIKIDWENKKPIVSFNVDHENLNGQSVVCPNEA